VAAYDRSFERLAGELTEASQVVAGGEAAALARLQGGGRVLVERMALLLQAAVLLDHAPADVAESFVRARLGEDRGREYGALPDGVAVDLLVDRAIGG
jgi:putative acyl-CoA dehydrogenase